METLPSLKPISISKAERPLDEIKVHLGRTKTIFGQIKENELEQKELTSKTHTDANNSLFVKRRKLMVFIAAFVEALLSIRAFGFILHALLNIPYGPNSLYLDFFVGLFFSYLIIEGSIWTLNFERKLKTENKEKIWWGFMFLALVPILNVGIFFQTEDKSGEWIFLVLSLFTFVLNMAIVTLVSRSQIDSRFDQISKGEGERLESLKTGNDRLFKQFDQARHRIEYIAPSFLKAYKQLSANDQQLITFGVDYLYVLQERIFAGQSVHIIDASLINPVNYPYIEQWDKVVNRQSLL